ncbi:MerR family transcriptional regulator, partial [Streptomyces sp. NPDC127112]|uniref:MerR family transcriptional regulator n=1 Tax=Streptomyces sp. NPDC127112 TaxID=3345364 RepID=UPI003625F8A1
MLIGELAEATGTSARALRHYEGAGLISSERLPNGYRVYDERAVVRVRNIRTLLDAGLTLDDVRVFLPCLDGDVAAGPPSPEGLAVARRRLAVLEARVAGAAAPPAPPRAGRGPGGGAVEKIRAHPTQR